MFNSFLFILEKTNSSTFLDNLQSRFRWQHTDRNITLFCSQQPLVKAEQCLVINSTPKIKEICKEKFLTADRAELFSDLHGQYQLAFFDLNSGQVVIELDYLTSLPVYYFESEQLIAVSNELRHLHELLKTELKLNHRKLIQYVAGTFTETKETLYQDILALNLNEKLVIENSKVKISSSKIRILEKKVKIKGDAVSNLRELLEVISSEYTSVDAAFELSGGLDSSCVAALSKKSLQNKIQCYSIEYDDISRDERSYQKCIADFLEAERFNFPNKSFCKDEIASLVSALRYFPDYANSLQSVQIFEKMQSHGKDTLLTGFGGDHFFASKPIALDYLQVPKIIKQWIRIKRYYPWLKKQVEIELLDQVNQKNYLCFTKQQRGIIKEVFSPTTIELIRSAQNLASLYGIVRLHPLFDARILSFCLCLETEKFEKNGISKFLLREACKDILPAEIFNRASKAEFTKSFSEVLSTTWGEDVLERGLKRFNILFELGASTRINSAQKIAQSKPYVAWNILALELFMQNSFK